MAQYLLIQSRDPYESAEAEYLINLAANLVRAKHQVTVFLIQNGVLAARRGETSGLVKSASEAGASVLADEFSLRERGISTSRLASDVRSAPLDVVIDHLAAGQPTLWH